MFIYRVLSTPKHFTDLIYKLAATSLESGKTIVDEEKGIEFFKYEEDDVKVYWELGRAYYNKVVCSTTY